MTKYTFEEIKNSDNVIYSYIRGSHAYGLQKDDGTSDIDTAFVYLEPIEQIMGLGLDYQEQVADERNDNVGYSLKKFMTMLLSSNPTVLESLFIPERCILYEHPIMAEIKKHKDKFLTKACFKPFLGYAYEQIKKCRGLNKRFLQENIERKQPLDFAYTFYKQGSTKIENWLEHRGLYQKYCGLVNIPNMGNTMSVYYDWGNHFMNEKTDYDLLVKCYAAYSEDDTVGFIHERKELEMKLNDNATELNDDEVTKIKSRLEEIKLGIHYTQLGNMVRFICNTYNVDIISGTFKTWFENQKPIGYKGMVGEDKLSNELRLSSVAKDEKPICTMVYNKDAYSNHCADYKHQEEWKANRNPERYKENCGKQFDRKNVAHSVRLLHMGIEIANGQGFNVDRSGIDRDFIMNIRQGNTSYEEIIAYIESKKNEMEEVMKNSTLPDNIDVDFVNSLLLDIRKKQIENVKEN